MQRVAIEFEKIQREHLLRENEDFLAKIETTLGPAQLIEMGGKMAALRGLNNQEEVRLAV